VLGRYEFDEKRGAKPDGLNFVSTAPNRMAASKSSIRCSARFSSTLGAVRRLRAGAVGLTLTFGVMRMVNFAEGQSVMIGASSLHDRAVCRLCRRDRRAMLSTPLLGINPGAHRVPSVSRYRVSTA